jgi:hypothetical protein
MWTLIDAASDKINALKLEITELSKQRLFGMDIQNISKNYKVK